MHVASLSPGHTVPDSKDQMVDCVDPVSRIACANVPGFRPTPTIPSSFLVVQFLKVQKFVVRQSTLMVLAHTSAANVPAYAMI